MFCKSISHLKSKKKEFINTSKQNRKHPWKKKKIEIIYKLLKYDFFFILKIVPCDLFFFHRKNDSWTKTLVGNIAHLF